MAKGILKNVRLFAGGCDLTSQGNKLDFGGEFEEKDTTTWGSYDAASDKIAKEVIGGLWSAKISASGFWDAGDLSLVDDSMWAERGTRQPWTVCPSGIALGSLAYIQQALHSSYQLLGQVGDVAPWQASLAGSGFMARGQVVVPPTVASGASFGSAGYIRIVGGVPADKSLFASLHVLSVAGTGSPTISALIQSDDNSSFTSPTHQVTFDVASGISGQVKSIPGPITDEYFDVYADLTGTGQSFLIFMAVGIG